MKINNEGDYKRLYTVVQCNCPPLKVKNMITVTEFKKLYDIKSLELTDEEIKAVINLLYQLSDLLFEIWIEEKNK